MSYLRGKSFLEYASTSYAEKASYSVGEMKLPQVLALVLATLVFSITNAQEKDRLSEYRLGPGDQIRVSVFRNPDLTLETRVGEDGAKALVAGNYIPNAQVTILLLQTRSSQVEVLGLVNRVSEMIAIAGGDLAILTGERQGKPLRKEIDIAALFGEKGYAEDLAVAGGDVIYVERAPMLYVYGEVTRPGERGTERNLRLLRNPRLDDLVRPEDVLHVGESLF